jgi:hypothetical protein
VIVYVTEYSTGDLILGLACETAALGRPPGDEGNEAEKVGRVEVGPPDGLLDGGVQKVTLIWAPRTAEPGPFVPVGRQIYWKSGITVIYRVGAH